MATMIRQFRTGYLHTIVLDAGDGSYTWVRRAGPDRDRALGPPSAALREVIATVGGTPVTLAMPELEAQHDGVAYRVGGSSSVAHLLLGVSTGVPATVTPVLRGAGAALAGLHGCALPAGESLPAPPGWRRLARWLRTAAGPRAVARLHTHLTPALGRRRVSTAEGWCDPVEGRRVLLHGGPGTGSLIVGGVPGTGHLLTGEDLSAGPAESDLGWMLGELVELREAGPSPARDDYDAMIAAFLSGYGRAVDHSALGRYAALRLLVHLHDFAATWGWHDSLVGGLELVARALDAAESSWQEVDWRI